MSNNNVPRLCGGTFFLQILRMKKPMSRKKENGLVGEKDKVNNQRALEALIQLFDPSYKVYSDGSFKGDTSAYRACTKSVGSNLPFSDKYANFTPFDNIVKNNYERILPRIKHFTDTFIDTDKPRMVNSAIKALLSCVEHDETISSDTEFYMGEMGHPITKEALIQQTDISLDSFLLGLWHFILLNRQNNLVGRDTYEAWYSPDGDGKPWKHNPETGSDYHNIRIHRTGDSFVINDHVNQDFFEEEPFEEDECSYETDNSDDPGLKEYKQFFIQQNFINNGVYIQQNANTINNIAYVEHLE